MKKKFGPCFNCYKYYYNTDVEICIASFPCKHLAENYIDYYADYIDNDDSDICYYVKKQTIPHFDY